MNIFLYFIIYSILGWILESLFVSISNKRLINSGFLMGPYCPIYGLGAIIVIYILKPFHDHLLLFFILSILLTSILEYFTSYLLEKIFKILWWDYSKHKYQLHGRVCLINSFLFGIISILVIYFIHPIITVFIENSSSILLFITIIFILLLLIDLIYSMKRFIKFKQDSSSFHIDLKEIKVHIHKFISYKNKRN